MDPSIAQPAPTRAMQQLLERGDLPLFTCTACAYAWYLPRARCPRCGLAAPGPQAASGRGRLHAVTRVHHGAPEPWLLAIVALDEGPLALGRLEGWPGAGRHAASGAGALPPIGLRLRSRIVAAHGPARPVFEPVPDDA